MVILAQNKGKGISRKALSDLIWSMSGVVDSIVLCVLLVGMSVYCFITLPSDRNTLGYIFLAVTLLPIFSLLSCLDVYLRWERARETVSVQYETLVIECSGCIFRRRRKEIPLSTIRRVELCESDVLWLRGIYPDRLRVVYSGTHTYRFGICMSPEDRDKLADTITQLAKCYL